MKGGPINSARILYFTFHVFLYFCKDFKQLKVFFSSSNFWKRKYLQEKKNSEEAFQLKKLLRQFQKKIRKVRLGELTFDRLFPPKFFFNFQKSFSVSLSLSVPSFWFSFSAPFCLWKLVKIWFPYFCFFTTVVTSGRKTTVHFFLSPMSQSEQGRLVITKRSVIGPIMSESITIK